MKTLDEQFYHSSFRLQDRPVPGRKPTPHSEDVPQYWQYVSAPTMGVHRGRFLFDGGIVLEVRGREALVPDDGIAERIGIPEMAVFERPDRTLTGVPVRSTQRFVSINRGDPAKVEAVEARVRSVTAGPAALNPNTSAEDAVLWALWKWQYDAALMDVDGFGRDYPEWKDLLPVPLPLDWVPEHLILALLNKVGCGIYSNGLSLSLRLLLHKNFIVFWGTPSHNRSIAAGDGARDPQGQSQTLKRGHKWTTMTKDDFGTMLKRAPTAAWGCIPEDMLSVVEFLYDRWKENPAARYTRQDLLREFNMDPDSQTWIRSLATLGRIGVLLPKRVAKIAGGGYSFNPEMERPFLLHRRRR